MAGQHDEAKLERVETLSTARRQLVGQAIIDGVLRMLIEPGRPMPPELYSWHPDFHLFESGVTPVNLSGVTAVNLGVAPAHPGEPIHTVWELLSIGSAEFANRTMIAEIFLTLGNSKLYQSPAVTAASTGGYLDTGLQQATILPPPDGGTASALYRFGSHQLRLDVLPDGVQGVLTTYADLLVVPESQPALWSWTQLSGTVDPSASLPPNIPLLAQYTDFVINHPYTLSGRLRNNCVSPDTNLTGTATLYELHHDTGETVEVESQPFNIGPQGDSEITFRPITENWTWLIPGLWTRNPVETLTKTFTYTVRFTASDQYGNFYAESPPSIAAIVTVSVSGSKLALQQAALGVLAAGVLAGIFSFGAALGPAMAAAGGLGKAAMDPPGPDPRYREAVPLPWAAPDQAETGGGQFAALVQVLNHVGRIEAILEAMGITHGRLLAARLADDHEAIDLQRQTYRNAVGLLLEAAGGMVGSLSDLEASWRDDPDLQFDAVRQRVRALQLGGLPPAAREQLQDQGVPDESMSALVAAVRDDTVAALATDVQLLFRHLAWAFALLAAEVQRETPAILLTGADEDRGQ